MSDLLKLSPAEFCAATKACEEGRGFAIQHPTMGEVWDVCPRPDWLLWLVDRLGQRLDDRTLRLFAVWCARNTPLGDGRVTGDLLKDPRSLAALDVAERYANGQATAGELVSAAFAAAAAASAAAYAASAAAYAASAAAYAAYADAADDDASAAAYAAYAAAADDDAPAAAYAACAFAAYADAADVVASRRAQADQLRRMVPNPFRAKEVKP